MNFLKKYINKVIENKLNEFVEYDAIRAMGDADEEGYGQQKADFSTQAIKRNRTRFAAYADNAIATLFQRRRVVDWIEGNFQSTLKDVIAREAREEARAMFIAQQKQREQVYAEIRAELLKRENLQLLVAEIKKFQLS